MENLEKEFPMKNNPRLINIVLAGCLLLLVLTAHIPAGRVQGAGTEPEAQTQAEGCDSTRTVQVNGSAMINVVPDRALIQLGVQSNGATIDDVESANTQAVQRVT